MKTEGKSVIRIDMIMVAASVLVLLGVALFSSGVMSSGADAKENRLFYFKSGNVILIDTNASFRSPVAIQARDNLVINIVQGVYYWKIADAFPEDIVELNITERVVNLKLKKTTEGYDVVNYENSSLNVDIYNKGQLSGRVILGSSDDDAVSEIVYIGRMNG